MKAPAWQNKMVEDSDVDTKKQQDDLSQQMNQNSESMLLSNSTNKSSECCDDDKTSNNNSRNNVNGSSSIASKHKNKEVSRKGNGMGVNGWKSQFCMNGITFCFKVGTL